MVRSIIFWSTIVTLVPRLCAQHEFTLAPLQDAVVGIHPGYGTENNNFATADHFSCTSQPGNLGGENNARSLLAFDLSTIATGSLVDSARLDLYGRGPNGTGASTSLGNNGANTAILERIVGPWSDNTVTWDTRPSTTSLNAVLLPQSITSIQDYLGVDVTALVQDMLDNPANSHGFFIRLLDEDPTRGMYFCSSEFPDPAKHPVLHIYLKDDVSLAENSFHPTVLNISPSSIVLGESARIDLVELRKALLLLVFDSSGRTVAEHMISGKPTINLDTADLGAGAYQVVVLDADRRSIGFGRFVAR